MEKTNLEILQNIFLCVQQKKKTNIYIYTISQRWASNDILFNFEWTFK